MAQCALGAVPDLVTAHALLGAQRQREARLAELECCVGLPHHRDQAGDLAADLVEPAVDVRVVLREGAHAGEAVQRAGALEAMQPPEVGVPDRQLTVRVDR